METDNKYELLLHDLLNLSQEDFAEYIEHVHPSDLLELINDDEIEFDRKALLERLPDELIADLLDEEEEEDKYELLLQVREDKRKQIIDEMSSDELVDMLNAIEDADDKQEVIELLDQEDQKEVQQLLSYDEYSAGGIMATEFISIYDNKTIRKVLAYLREIKNEVENPFALYVTDRQHHLKGVLSLSDIVTADLDAMVLDVMNPNVIAVHYKMDQEEVAREFKKYNFLAMPVIDDDNRIIGVITVDDIMEVMAEEATADMLQMAGVHAEETVDSSIVETIKSRLPWLLVNLLTAIFASSIVNFFSDTIAKVVVLAALNPIITGMGGNAGTQTLTLICRSIALGEIDKSNSLSTLFKEIVSGLFNGLTIGLLVGTVGYVLSKNVWIGVIVGFSMMVNMVVAVIAGFGIPLFLEKIKVDPAVASAVFVTTFTDSMGFMVFLGLATIFIEKLI